MYMDCSFDGEAPERGGVVDHTPNDEEWRKIASCFPGGKTSEIISALRSKANTPLEKSFHSQVTWARIGGMNNALRKAGIAFRLTPAFKGKSWDHIRLERIPGQKEQKSEVSPEKIMRCCP